MKFLIIRTSTFGTDKKPCIGAIPEFATYVDWRTVENLSDVSTFLWGEEWLKNGKNHRQENGMVARDVGKEQVYTIEIVDLNELLEFIDVYGDVVVSKCENYKEIGYQLEIYDGYRE